MDIKKWLSRKHRLCHITLRDIDIPDFDVEQLMGDLTDLNIDTATLFAGGYIATYPSKLSWQRQCPGLDGRDLFGELLAAGIKHKIKIVPCIDIGEIPMDLALAQPELGARDATGAAIEKSAVTAKSCALAPYVREYHKLLLDELTERYDIDSIKWAGASYGGTPVGCQCHFCQQRYQKDNGCALPTTDHANNDQYMQWLECIFQETAALLKNSASERGLFVVGNSVWHLGRGKRDICALAEKEDITQIETQSRYYHWTANDRSDFCWERFSNPVESTNYISNVSKNPPWVVSSYFLAWPWRWAGVPAVEQEVYFSQVAANGGSPMVNFTTGAPHQHYDQRGMAGLKGIFSFMQQHDDVFQDDASAAQIAVIYDHRSACGSENDLYMDEFYGIEDMLYQRQVPFDVINSERLQDVQGRHQVLIIPHASHLTADIAQAINEKNIPCLWTGAPGIASNENWQNIIGIHAFKGSELFLETAEASPMQAYGQFRTGNPLASNIATDYLAMDDRYYQCHIHQDAQHYLQRIDSFRLFPEGQSYPDDSTPRDSLCFHYKKHLVMPIHFGLVANSIAHPDYAQLLINSIALLSNNTIGPSSEGRAALRVSTRRCADGQLAYHLINTQGNHRFRHTLEPIHQLRINIDAQVTQAQCLRNNQQLEILKDHDQQFVIIPQLDIYDILLCS
ncbi:MAG: hypothetical protein HRU15_00045 [Planctomycetes bacterium]|nr:hypothetical protein [Planctomycetota bacterium]